MALQPGFPSADFPFSSAHTQAFAAPRMFSDQGLNLPTTRESLLITHDSIDPGWQDGPHLSSSNSGSPYSTSSEDPSTWPVQPSPYPRVSQGSRSPVMDPYVPMGYSTSPPSSIYYHPVMLTDDDTIFTPQPIGISLVRSLPPHLAEVQTSEPLVPASASLSTERLMPYDTKPRGTTGLLAKWNSIPLDSVPAYVETYWRRVHAAYPVVHRPTFEASVDEKGHEHVELLRCAMASIATQYHGKKEDRVKGDQLHRHAWHRSKLVSIRIPSIERW
jgi:hypothetical protein